MNVEYKNNPIVKSLLNAGFGEEYIEKAIASGDIKIEKAEDKSAAGDHESESKQEKDIDKLEKEAVKKEIKVKEDEKDTAEDKNAEGIKKSEDEKEDLKKSIEDALQKSMSAFVPLFEGMQRQLDGMSSKLEKIGEQTPSFKSEGLDNMSALQKSINIEKDETGKYAINVIEQRAMATKAIEKAIESAPEMIAKSLEDEALAYLTNPYADTVGENLARYMYEKGGIKFVK